MADYAVMPYADYEDACNAVREKTGGTEAIKSGDLRAQIRAIASGGGSAAPKAVYATSNIDTGFVCQRHDLPESDYSYLLDCTHLLVVSAGANTDAFSAFINIETGEGVTIVDGEVDTSVSFEVIITDGEEEDEGAIILTVLVVGVGDSGYVPGRLSCSGDYYIVGATL